MQGPDYGNISRIDPDGGQAYTTLQAWYDDTWDEAEIQHAECYSGDAVGLGKLDTSSHTPSYQGELDADHPVCIYAADGHEQDGSQDDALQGAAIVVIAPPAFGILSILPFVCLSGLRITTNVMLVTCINLGFPNAGGQGGVVERCMLVINSVFGPAAGGLFINAVNVVDSVVLRNNLIINKHSAQDATGIYIATLHPSAAISAEVYANSVANCASAVGGIAVQQHTPGTLDIVARNNVVVHDGNQSGNCFDDHEGPADWTGSTHNVSSDATAKGTDANTNAAIADVWADIADNDAPFAPKAGGDLDPPDGANLYADGVTADALGVERPSFGAQYRGGLEIFCGLYKAYGGATPALVDYATMLASVRAGSTGIDVTGLGLASGGTHYLGLRATSVAGVEEDNTDRLTRAVVNQSGQLQPLPLAAVEELTAELQTDGTVIVGFSHKTWPGWGGPTRFEVLSDNGTGELNLTTPAATIDVTDPGAGDYEVALNPPTLPAMFSARACSGADDGPVAPPVTVSPPAGPAAPQQV